MAMFNCYVSLPEGKTPFSYGFPMVFHIIEGFESAGTPGAPRLWQRSHEAEIDLGEDRKSP